MADRLTRLHRVRTLQVALARAEEARAQEMLASEAGLRDRIRSLAQAVAPAPDIGGAFSLAAAAHYRERLQHSAATAEQRVASAEAQAARAGEAMREARRDQEAAEKLMGRAALAEALRELRKLEEQPAVRKVRHGSC